jgi:hypothetical protein
VARPQWWEGRSREAPPYPDRWRSADGELPIGLHPQSMVLQTSNRGLESVRLNQTGRRHLSKSEMGLSKSERGLESEPDTEYRHVALLDYLA